MKKYMTSWSNIYTTTLMNVIGRFVVLFQERYSKRNNRRKIWGI